MADDKNNFIKKIKFEEEFLPFKKDDEVVFWGDSEVQELIEFYLKNNNPDDKPDEEIKRNAWRFKINCVLGNNWGGKSRLFEWILDYDFAEIVTNNSTKCLCTTITWNNYKTTIDLDKEIIEISNLICLDDFFILSNNNTFSSNNYMLWWRWYSNDFIFYFYNLFVTVDKNVLNCFLWNSINNFWFLGWFGNHFISTSSVLKNNKNSITKSQKNKNRYILSYKLLNTLSDNFSFNKTNALDFKKYNHEKYSMLNFFNIKGDRELLFLFDFIFTIYTNSKDKKFINILSDSNLMKIIIENKNIFWQLILNYFIKVIEVIKLGWNKKEDLENTILIKNKDKFIILYKEICLNNENLILLFDKLENNEPTIKELNNILLKIWEDIKNIDLSNIKKDNFIYNNTYLWDTKEIISDDEKYILSTFFSITDIDFWNKKYSDLSAWEKIIFIRISNIHSDITETYKRNKNKWFKNFTILIDEPDLHLHLDWQKKYIQKLIDVFSTLDTEIKLHFIIATHSPFIISDLPSECIIILDKQEWKKYTQIKNYDWNKQTEKLKNKTFWANYIDIIRDWFFFQEGEALMGSFAENIIWNIAHKERKDIINWDIIDNKLKENIWDDFLKNNLLYFKWKNND